jgi:hypothetical protein
MLYSFSGKPVSFTCPLFVHQGKYSSTLALRPGMQKKNSAILRNSEWQFALQVF